MNRKTIYRNIILVNFLIPLTAMVVATFAVFYGMGALYGYFGLENLFKNPVMFWILCWFLWFHYTKFLFNQTYVKLTHFDPTFSISSKKWNLIRVIFSASFISIFYSIFWLENECMQSVLLAFFMFGFFLGLHFIPKLVKKKKKIV